MKPCIQGSLPCGYFEDRDDEQLPYQSITPPCPKAQSHDTTPEATSLGTTT